jgi:hypothetical protein
MTGLTCSHDGLSHCFTRLKSIKTTKTTKVGLNPALVWLYSAHVPVQHLKPKCTASSPFDRLRVTEACSSSLICRSLSHVRPHRLTVRTRDSHSRNRGSIPREAASLRQGFGWPKAIETQAKVARRSFSEGGLSASPLRAERSFDADCFIVCCNARSARLVLIE